LRLLGPPRLERNGERTPFPLRKAIALLSFLAIEKREFTREYLACLLWPDKDRKSALADLRRTISAIRRVAGPETLSVSGRNVELNRDAILVDVDEFHENSCSQSQTDGLGRLARAVDLYRGMFLEGFNLGQCLEFDEWQDSVRQNLHWEAEAVLENLSLGHLENGEPDTALAFAERWLALNPDSERASRAVIESLWSEGRITSARKQLDNLITSLARDGYDPEDQTLILAERLRHTTPAGPTRGRTEGRQPASPGRRPKSAPGRKLRVWARGPVVAAAIGTAIIVAALFNLLRGPVRPTDFSIGTIAINAQGDTGRMLDARILNEGPLAISVHYIVFCSEDEIFGLGADFIVYSDEITLRADTEAPISLGLDGRVQDFIDSHGTRIPPGEYYVGLYLDPEHAIREASESNNWSITGPVFLRGSVHVESFEVNVDFPGSLTLDEQNPLRVFIGAEPFEVGYDGWGAYEVTSPGSQFFPLDLIRHQDVNDAGYFMFVYYDHGGDMDGPADARTDDIAAIYKSVPGGLVYGGVSAGSGSKVHPGQAYAITFDPPPPPGPDAFELDDNDAVATSLDYATDLPLTHLHTFHDTGTGDDDADWYRVRLPVGGSLVVETFSADRYWEPDTDIVIRNAAVDWVAANDNKSDWDDFSRVSYVNDTGIAQEFFISIYFHHPETGDMNNWGEYLVTITR